MKMLTSASSASKDRSFGFSVKDILDLPSTKPPRSNPNSSPISNGASSLLDANGDNCLSSNSPAYHPAAAALYYTAGICDNPYARWLPPPSDMFAYSTSLRKY